MSEMHIEKTRASADKRKSRNSRGSRGFSVDSTILLDPDSTSSPGLAAGGSLREVRDSTNRQKRLSSGLHKRLSSGLRRVSRNSIIFDRENASDQSMARHHAHEDSFNSMASITSDQNFTPPIQAIRHDGSALATPVEAPSQEAQPVPSPERKVRSRRSFLGFGGGSSSGSVRSSPSLHSLRSFLDTPSSHGNGSARDNRRSTFFGRRDNISQHQQPISISQPTLVDSSREKMKNKLMKHSPSLLSVNASGSMLSSEYDERQLAELKKLCSEQFDSLSAVLTNAMLVSHTGSGAQLYIQNGTSLLKVIPLDRIPAAEVLQEITLTRMIAQVPGFVNIETVTMAEDKFCVLKQPWCGTDLKRWRAASPEQAELVFWKVANALADAEDQFQFEHRNLHAGHVAVTPEGEVTILSLSHARATDPFSGQVYSTSLDHQGLFRGRADLLPAMQRMVGPDPNNFAPTTNVLWLASLANQLQLRRIEDLIVPNRWSLKRQARSAREATSFANRRR